MGYKQTNRLKKKKKTGQKIPKTTTQFSIEWIKITWYKFVFCPQTGWDNPTGDVVLELFKISELLFQEPVVDYMRDLQVEM